MTTKRVTSSPETKENGYDSESSLVDHFVGRLEAALMPWGTVQVGREFDYSRGRTDVIALTESGQVIAFEAKLTRWKEALDQAYRNRCFAHHSFVVFPKQTAMNAYRREAEFTRRGVGICYLENDQIIILLDPQHSDPLQPWLTEIASARASGGSD
ncbi:MAG TPA: hypothetical protein VGU64_13525 [Terriglobales bacterium]|nr:hypothetical protein [Terriglobales bacterium]